MFAEPSYKKNKLLAAVLVLIATTLTACGIIKNEFQADSKEILLQKPFVLEKQTGAYSSQLLDTAFRIYSRTGSLEEKLLDVRVDGPYASVTRFKVVKAEDQYVLFSTNREFFWLVLSEQGKLLSRFPLQRFYVDRLTQDRTHKNIRVVGLHHTPKQNPDKKTFVSHDHGLTWTQL